VLALTGCSSPPTTVREVPHWELAHGGQVQFRLVARVRVHPDRPLPGHLVQRLAPEYSLVVVHRAADWQEVQRRLGFSAEGVRLSDGPIVGLLAEVGEKMDGRWPLQLVSVRAVDGVGLVEASFLHGLYYPLQTAGYLELAQVRGVQAVGAVQINSRLFTIRPAGRFD